MDAKEAVVQQSVVEMKQVEFGRFRRPEEVVDEAAHVARVFQDKMLAIKDAAGEPILFRMFGNSRHITRPGWQLLGSMYRVTAGIAKTEYVEFGEAEGFEATAEAIYVPTGARISTADAMCTTDEPNWDTRPTKRDPDARVPLFQLRSMAQTRACSKVLSNLLSYVAVMAGCSGTSAEEMTGQPMMNGQGQAPTQQPQRTQNGNGTITDPQVNRLFALNKTAGRSREGLGVILAAHGYSAPDGDVDVAARLVKKGDFDKIQEQVMKPV